MALFRGILTLFIVCLASSSAAQVQDEVAAARVLGPHWRQVARTSGMIFAGTVLKIESKPAGKGNPLPLILTTFRVNRPIVGVRAGERLTIREWEGARSAQRAMSRGQRMLVFLYPPSRLGLTSLVGGRTGQVILDARGEIPDSGEGRGALSLSGEKPNTEASNLAQVKTPPRAAAITVAQLERAIRRARQIHTIARRDHVQSTPSN